MRRLLPLLLLLLLPAAARAQEPLPTQWHKGVDVTAFAWNDLQGPKFDRRLKETVDKARASEVTFVVTWYQWFSGKQRTDDLNANGIHPAYGSAKACKGYRGRDQTRCKTPSLGDLASAVRKARKLGLRVNIRPQLDVGKTAARSKPRDLIDQGDSERRNWFDAYKAMLSRYARVARDTGASGLYIGAGLSAMTSDDKDRNEWRAIAKDVRSGALMGDGKGGYKGEVLYAAQWDAVVEDALDPATHLSFWDAVDVISVDAYFPIAAGAEPSEDELRSGWTTTATGGLPLPPAQIVRNLHAEYGKQVRFSALGYTSREGSAAFPEKGDAEQAAAGGKVSETTQLRATRAAFDIWGGIAAEGWFEGISWWEWPASGGRGGPKDGSFSFQGKRALGEICRRHSASDAGC